MKRRKWMALMLCAGIFMADFSGIPLKVSAEQVEQAETTLDDQGTQKDDGENTELIQETEDENNSEESPIETEPEESAAEDIFLIFTRTMRTIFNRSCVQRIRSLS